MAYDFQGLVNDVLLEVNESTLDTETEFNAAVGFHKWVKNAVNWAINYIYFEEDCEWPFAKVNGTVTCTIGQGDASTPLTLATAASYDWDSFYIPYMTGFTYPEQRRLPWITLNDYRANAFDSDMNNLNTTTAFTTKPRNIVRAQDNKLIITPLPDAAYDINYEYFAYPVPLINATDTTLIPEMYRGVIGIGALYRVYRFRSDLEMANITLDDFKDQINQMRRLLIPQEESIRFVG